MSKISNLHAQKNLTHEVGQRKVVRLKGALKLSIALPFSGVTAFALSNIKLSKPSLLTYRPCFVSDFASTSRDLQRKHITSQNVHVALQRDRHIYFMTGEGTKRN